MPGWVLLYAVIRIQLLSSSARSDVIRPDSVIVTARSQLPMARDHSSPCQTAHRARMSILLWSLPY